VVSRRGLLGGAAAVAGASVAGCGTRAAPPVPHQPGVVTPPPATATLAAFDVTVTGREALAGLLSDVGTRIGAVHAATGSATATVAVGASLFDDRFGLGPVRPARLTTMPEFRGDVLDPAWCHGDLLLQVCAEQPDRVRAIVEDLHAVGGTRLRTRWRLDGFRSENVPIAGGRVSTRNLFGFREGAGNPSASDPALMDRLVWVPAGGGEPAWATGGTYQAVRLIRFATNLWNAEPESRQEAVFGRHKTDGVPLGHHREDERFDYSDDRDGLVIGLDAHIRRANPRTAATERNRILRRGYSYRRNPDAAGRPDEGLIFVCFQQDLERGFATIQRRLAGEALEKYVLPFGGGYFFVPPGAGSARDDYPGRGLVAPDR
jgi:deferrochelatase/peroxidase EfeB